LSGSKFSAAAGLKSGQFDRERNFDPVKFPKKQSIDPPSAERMPIDELRNSFYFII